LYKELNLETQTGRLYRNLQLEGMGVALISTKWLGYPLIGGLTIVFAQ
jgi:hypothetical protein